jgi:hypothetical protein
VSLLAFHLAAAERLACPLQKLFLPGINLAWMHLKLRGQFVDGFVPLECFDSNLGLEIGTL